MYKVVNQKLPHMGSVAVLHPDLFVDFAAI